MDGHWSETPPPLIRAMVCHHLRSATTPRKLGTYSRCASLYTSYTHIHLYIAAQTVKQHFTIASICFLTTLYPLPVTIHQLFHTRYALHKRAYQHRVCRAVELMIVEVFLLADPHLLFMGSGGQLRHMSECHLGEDDNLGQVITDCGIGKG